MKKLLFVITDLSGGGAERVLLDTVKKLKQDYEISVLSIFNKGVYIDQIKNITTFNYIYNVPNNKFLSKLKVFILLRYMKFVNLNRFISKKYRKDFDIEIAFLEGIPTKMVIDRKSTAFKIGWVHIDPIALPYSTKYFKNKSEEKEYYQALDQIVCVSNDVKNSFVEKFSMVSKVDFIENIYDFDSILAKKNQNSIIKFNSDNFNIVCVGKLMKQKAYDRIIYAFNKLDLSDSKYKVHILGEGEERKNLENLIIDCNLENNIFLHGYQDNPYNIMKQADLFLSSSFTEGYSTVVVEAIVVGLPILVTDCSGMRDILGENEYGMIVDNSVDGVIDGLSKVINEENLIRELRSKSSNRKDFYLSDVGFKKITNMLERI